MKKSQQEIAETRHGCWREELLFELEASFNFYKLYEKALKECNQMMENALIKNMPLHSVSEWEEKVLQQSKKKSSKNTPEFNNCLSLL